MATSIGKLSKSFFIKLLVGIIILPFVFWGMGDVFSGGNQNVIATMISGEDMVIVLRVDGEIPQNLRKSHWKKYERSWWARIYPPLMR